MSVQLKQDAELQQSAVVANCRMNRERELCGSNGYDRELRMSPLAFLEERLTRGQSVRWLDLCCGTGRALFQASERLQQSGLARGMSIVGIDLVGMFWSGRPKASFCAPPGLCLLTQPAQDHAPEGPYDLITCVH